MLAPRSWPLRQQLFALMALGLLPLVIFAAWGLWNGVDRQRVELERSTLDLSRALASAVRTELDSTVAGLYGLSQAPALYEENLAEFYGIARNTVALHRGWSGIILTDGQGKVQFKTALPYGSADGRIVDPKSLDQVLRTRAVAVGHVSAGQVGTIGFPVRIPVMRDGQLAHVLTAAVKPDPFLDILKKQKLPSSWVVSIFDSGLLRVARSKDHAKTVGTPPSVSLEASLRASGGEGNAITQTLEGDTIITGSTRVGGYGWTVSVGAPTAELTAGLLPTVGLYGLGVGASLLICAVLGYLLARRISQDIGGVRDMAVAVGQGGVVQPRRSTIREVDETAAALGQASSQLNTALATVREALHAAEQAAKVKDDFLAVLGHELRNPLAPIVSALYLLDRKCDASTLRERQIMQRQVDHMRRLVDDLLDVSRIARGKLTVHLGPVDLSALVARAAEAACGGDPRLAAQLELQLPTSPVWTHGDAARLAQVVANLLSNAGRFAQDKPVVLSLEAGDHSACLSVRDSGVGMAPETTVHVFEPFYQAPQPAARSAGGLGLGLAIVKTIVEMHSGTVTATSPGLGQGCRIDVVLPRIKPPAAMPAGPRQAAPAASAGRADILVVDDNADQLDTLGQILRAQGHEVRTAASPGEALACVAHKGPEIAIFDVGMPGMDGYELLKTARAQSPSWRGRCVALTGYGQAIDKDRAAQAGFDLHLTKPVDAAHLIDVIEMLRSK